MLPPGPWPLPGRTGGAEASGSGLCSVEEVSAAFRSDLSRRTEIELMNGYIASEGARVGVAAPTHEMLTRQVLRVERGEIAPRPENALVNS